jgi:putative oxidoreductase
MAMLDWIGRALLVTIYLWASLYHKTKRFTLISGLVGTALPFPKAATIASAILELTCSVVILLPAALVGNLAVDIAALGLAIYTMVAASLFHPFWKHTAELRLMHQVNFLKNIGLTGAFLMLIAAHPV